MKPDMKLFPYLKEDSQFTSWYKQLIGVMMGTNVGEVSLQNYTPPPQEVQSFANKCRWMFTVFDATVKTTAGRAILDQNRTRCDGRTVLNQLRTHYRDSTSARLYLRTIMDQLVNTPLTSSWNKPLEDYISWFVRLVNQYNDTVPEDDQRLTRGMIRTMLERNVLHCKPLAAVRTQELYEVARGRPPINLEQYVGLLRSAAALADTQMAAGRRGTSRRAHVHDTTPANADADGADADADSIAELDAYMMQRNPAASMDRSTWQSLDKSTHNAWDQISPGDKAKILSYAEARAARRSNPDGSTNGRRSAHVAETSDAPGSDDEADESPPSDQLEANKTDGSSPQQINAAKGSTHPGDMRRFLGQPGKTKTPSSSAKRGPPPARAAHTVRWAANTATLLPNHDERGDNQTPSGERGGDQIPPSVSAPPSNPPDLLDTSPSSELDLLWAPNPDPEDAPQADTYQPPVDDPFGLESIWEQDDRKDFW